VNSEELWRLPLDLSVRNQSVPLPPNSKPAPGRCPRHLTISSTIAATSLQQVLAATADGQLLAASMPKTDHEEIGQYRDLARFGKEVTCLAWSDSGSFVLVALADGTVHLGHCRLGEENWVWQDFQHGSTIRKLAVGPGGEWFASWDDRGKLCLWDAELLVPVFELVHLPEGCTALHTSPLGLHCRDGSGLWRTWRIPASSVQPH
jgi:WD40 repeat protein